MWMQSMDEKFDNLVRNNTFVPVHRKDLPTGVRPMSTRWVFKVKSDRRLKSRLVVRGFDEPVENQAWTYSPVVDRTSTRILAVRALTLGHESVVFDIASAYLEADIDESENYFVLVPEGVEAPPGTVFRLKTNFYGLRTAGARWLEKLRSTLTGLGWCQLDTDLCVFKKGTAALSTYVDDVRNFAQKKEIEGLVAEIHAEHPLTVSKPSDGYLGCEWFWNAEKKEVRISQERKIETFLKMHGMNKCKGQRTAMTKTTAEELEPETTGDRDPEYQSIVGTLNYLMNVAPELCYATNKLSRYNVANGKNHMNAAKKVLQYLQRAKENIYVIRGGEKPPEELQIKIYSDASFAGEKDTRSITGYVISIADDMKMESYISWGTRMQTTIAMSSSEAELNAMEDAVSEAMFVRNLCNELGMAQRPMKLYVDNQAAKTMIESGRLSRKTRGLKIRAMKIKELHDEGEIELYYCPTESMVADLMTKALPGLSFERHRDTILQAYPAYLRGGVVQIYSADRYEYQDDPSPQGQDKDP